MVTTRENTGENKLAPAVQAGSRVGGAPPGQVDVAIRPEVTGLTDGKNLPVDVPRVIGAGVADLHVQIEPAGGK